MNDVYRVDADGGTPMPVAADRYTTEYFARARRRRATSLAITARANAGSQWWRKGHSHLDESEIWLVKAGSGEPAYEPVTKGGAKDAWPMWSADGKTLYFMSDRSGAQNIWTHAAADAGEPRRRRSRASRTAACCGRRSRRTAGRSRSSATSGSGPSTPPTARRARCRSRCAARRRRPPSSTGRSPIRFRSWRCRPTARRSRSPCTARSSRRQPRTAATPSRVTTTAGEEAELAWSPDSRRLVYVSDRDGTHHLFLYDFAHRQETQLTSGRGARQHAALLAGREVDRVRARLTRAARDRSGDEGREAGRDRRVRHAAVRRRRATSPGRPTRGTSPIVQPGAKTFHERARRAGGRRAPEGRRGPADQLPGQHQRRLAVVEPGRHLPDVRDAQRTEPGDVVRVDLCRGRRRSARISSATCSRTSSRRRRTAAAAPAAEPEPAPRRPAAAPRRPPARPARGQPVEIVFDDIRRRASVAAGRRGRAAPGRSARTASGCC